MPSLPDKQQKNRKKKLGFFLNFVKSIKKELPLICNGITREKESSGIYADFAGI